MYSLIFLSVVLVFFLGIRLYNFVRDWFNVVDILFMVYGFFDVIYGGVVCVFIDGFRLMIGWI